MHYHRTQRSHKRFPQKSIYVVFFQINVSISWLVYIKFFFFWEKEKSILANFNYCKNEIYSIAKPVIGSVVWTCVLNLIHAHVHVKKFKMATLVQQKQCRYKH